MTPKGSKYNEKSFLLSLINTLNASQKECIILHGEIYIKKIYAEQLFGRQLTIYFR